MHNNIIILFSIFAYFSIKICTSNGQNLRELLNFTIVGSGKLYSVEAYCHAVAENPSFKQRENLLGRGEQKVPNQIVSVELKGMDNCANSLLNVMIRSEGDAFKKITLHFDLAKIAQIDNIIIDTWKTYTEVELNFARNPGTFIAVYCYKNVNLAGTSANSLVDGTEYNGKMTMIVLGGETLSANERTVNVLLSNEAERHNCVDGKAQVDAFDSRRGTWETVKVMTTVSLFKGNKQNDRVHRHHKMIEVSVNDRLGKKVRVKCMPDDTIGDLKKLIAAQIGTRADKIRLQKWYKVYNDHLELQDYEIHDGFNFELYYN